MARLAWMQNSWVGTGFVVLGLVAWLLSGQFSGESGPVGGADAAQPAQSVRVRELRAEAFDDVLVLQGVTSADRTVTVRAETTGPVIKLLVERGARVERGAAIARLAPDERAFSIAQAKSLLAERQLAFDAAERLRADNLRSAGELAAAKAALDAASAQLEYAELEYARTLISAPIAGVLNERHVEVGDFLGRGDPVATLVDLDPIRVVAEAAERHIDRLRPGTAGFAVLGSGERVEGALNYVDRVARVATRTYRVEMAIPNPAGKLPVGGSVRLHLNLGAVHAHRVEASALTLSDAGELGIMAVGEDRLAVFHPVEYLRESREGVWLTGLPETLTLITVGQEFVAPGKLVLPVPESDLQPAEAPLDAAR